MCLRFFLLITRLTSWLRLSQREETWKTREILILRHQLAVLQRREPRPPDLNWADRALLATMLGVIPKARRHGLRLLVTPTRSCAGIATSCAAAGPPGPFAARLAGRPPAGTPGPWSSGWPARTLAGDTAGSHGELDVKVSGGVLYCVSVSARAATIGCHAAEPDEPGRVLPQALAAGRRRARQDPLDPVLARHWGGGGGDRGRTGPAGAGAAPARCRHTAGSGARARGGLPVRGAGQVRCVHRR